MNSTTQHNREIDMDVKKQIKDYITKLPDPKSGEIATLNKLILKKQPKCKLWFIDGKNDDGKIVSNPSVGYGCITLNYADGKTKEFYQIGMSANTKGISVYIMGIEDKAYLAKTFGSKLGNASVSSYCIKFKTLKDINSDSLEEVITFGFENRE